MKPKKTAFHLPFSTSWSTARPSWSTIWKGPPMSDGGGAGRKTSDFQAITPATASPTMITTKRIKRLRFIVQLLPLAQKAKVDQC